MSKKTQNLKPIDLTEKLKPYEGKWVVLSLNHKKVLGTGDTLKKAEKKAQKKSQKYIFIKLPPFDTLYVPTQYL